MTVLHVDTSRSSEARAQAAAALRDARLVVAPTDTVYGVYADATSADAVRRLRSARLVPSGAPPTMFLHNPHHVLSGLVVGLTDAAERLIAAYWPGPLTLLLRPRPGLDRALGDEPRCVALRMPAEPLALQILHDVGPLACTAASVAGTPAPTTAAEAGERLGDVVDLYVDDGPRDGTRSTVVDLTRGGAHVLRVGAITAADVDLVAAGTLGWGERPG